MKNKRVFYEIGAIVFITGFILLIYISSMQNWFKKAEEQRIAKQQLDDDIMEEFLYNYDMSQSFDTERFNNDLGLLSNLLNSVTWFRSYDDYKNAREILIKDYKFSPDDQFIQALYPDLSKEEFEGTAVTGKYSLFDYDINLFPLTLNTEEGTYNYVAFLNPSGRNWKFSEPLSKCMLRFTTTAKGELIDFTGDTLE